MSVKITEELEIIIVVGTIVFENVLIEDEQFGDLVTRIRQHKNVSSCFPLIGETLGLNFRVEIDDFSEYEIEKEAIKADAQAYLKMIRPEIKF